MSGVQLLPLKRMKRTSGLIGGYAAGTRIWLKAALSGCAAKVSYVLMGVV